MFTIEQIKAAHSKVKSGADFPAYIHEIKKLGVTFYETFVADGRTDYYGPGNVMATWPPKYALLSVSDSPHSTRFKADLADHQKGKTDYLTFCKIAARHGVEKWAVSTEKMTCTYYDKAGNEILLEKIPQS